MPHSSAFVFYLLGIKRFLNKHERFVHQNRDLICEYLLGNASEAYQMCPNQGSNLFKSAVSTQCAAPSPGNLDEVNKEW